MPDYLLPCTCGKKAVVSTVQAGETIRCASCGAALPVPTMRGLRELEAVEPAGSAARRRTASAGWEDRHRAAFLFVLAAIACLGVAGYLWAKMPETGLPPAPPKSAAEIKSVQDAFALYMESQSGLPTLPPEVEAGEKARAQLWWGIVVAAGLAAAAGVGAVVVGLKRAPRRK
jgi:hypothetical protein